MATYYHFEREKVNNCWILLKKELEEKIAESYSKEREKEELNLSHQIEIKQKKQMYFILILFQFNFRVKHLLFSNLDQLTGRKIEAEETLKNVEDEHRINERELKADYRALKIQIKEQELRESDYLRALQKKHDKNCTRLRQGNLISLFPHLKKGIKWNLNLN
jgi:hypothetical protein